MIFFGWIIKPLQLRSGIIWWLIFVLHVGSLGTFWTPLLAAVSSITHRPKRRQSQDKKVGPGRRTVLNCANWPMLPPPSLPLPVSMETPITYTSATQTKATVTPSLIRVLTSHSGAPKSWLPLNFSCIFYRIDKPHYEGSLGTTQDWADKCAAPLQTTICAIQ